MRQSQQKNRMRGRGRKGPNPLSRTFESNGPDVKIRGTAAHVAEKYSSLARDALSAGDTVMAENYLQHAEHYNRIVAAAAAAQAPRAEDGANGHGRGPQPDVNGYSSGDDDGDDDNDNQPVHGRGDYSRGDYSRNDQPRNDQPRGEQAESGDQDRQVHHGRNGGGEAGEQRRGGDRGRRRQRPHETVNGNGHDETEAAEAIDAGDSVEKVADEKPRRRRRAGVSSDASMLPESIVGRGVEKSAAETAAED